MLVDHYFNNTYSPTYPQGLPTFLTIAADSPSWGLVGLGLWKAQISSNSLASGEGIRSGYGGKEGRNPRAWFLLEGANLTCTYSVPLLQSSLLPFKPILGIEFRSPGFCLCQVLSHLSGPLLPFLTECHCVAQASLRLWQSFCLYLLGAKIKGICHHKHLL